MKTETGKHTPLPWRAGKTQWNDGGRTPIYPADSDVEIASVNYTDGLGTQEKDAEFIVRACNSHYELLEAGKEALGQLKQELELNDDKYGELRPAIKKLEDTLAKAEGGE